MSFPERPSYWALLRALMSALLILCAMVALGLGSLYAVSPGRPEPLRYAAGNVIAGSISERVTVEIGGIPQGMFIQSVDTANRVLLFLHGGPGMVEFFMEQEYPTGLAQHFTMVWWEQRGAGMSFSPDIPPETVTLERMTVDTIEVADYLLDVYRARGDAGMLRRLEAAPLSMEDGTSAAWMRLRDRAMHGAGVGHMREMTSVITGNFVPTWRVRAYTLTEKINIWRGKIRSRPFFWEDLLRDNLSARLTEFDLPIYFLTGRHDYTANAELSRAYFDAIDAPLKGFYLFENAAHSPLFEEPERDRHSAERCPEPGDRHGGRGGPGHQTTRVRSKEKRRDLPCPAASHATHVRWHQSHSLSAVSDRRACNTADGRNAPASGRAGLASACRAPGAEGPRTDGP